MEGQAGRSAELVYRRSTPRLRTIDKVLPLVVFAGAVITLVTYAGGRAVGVVIGGSVVLLPALLIGARKVRTVPGRWRAGAEGERSTARVLRPLERHGSVVLNDLAVPGSHSRANIDHLLIHPAAGVLVIDSKRWSHPWQGDDRHGWQYQGRPVAEMIATTLWETRQVEGELSDVLGATRCPVSTILVVHGPLPHPELEISGVRIVGPERLGAILAAGGHRLDAHQVARIASVARTRLRPAG